jgi:Transglutaminase-like superfamily/Coenzyme PQQ synthesis protein D (PqqD)
MVEPAHRFARGRATSRRYVLSPDVIMIPLEDGTARLLDLDGSFFSLSQTAAQMLKGMLEQSELDTSQQIAAEYNADVDQVRADLTGLLATLRAKGLVRRSDDPLPVTRLRTAIAVTVCYPGLWILGLVHHRRLKTLALLALARLSFELVGWARTVDAWRKYLRTHHVLATGPQRQRLIDTIGSEIRRSPSGVASIACKERALCCWFMLGSAGIPARLVMGVQLSPFAGHCWCEVDGRILTDSPESCKAYSPVICYDG